MSPTGCMLLFFNKPSKTEKPHTTISRSFKRFNKLTNLSLYCSSTPRAMEDAFPAITYWGETVGKPQAVM